MFGFLKKMVSAVELAKSPAPYHGFIVADTG